MVEHETKRRRNRKRRKKKSSTSNTQNVQTCNKIQENSDIEEPATKKIRLDSQEGEMTPTSQVRTKTQLDLVSNSNKVINNTRVSEINGQESFHLNSVFDTQRTVSDGADMTASLPTLDTNGQVVDIYSNNHSAKTYTITEKDLIQLARIKENEQYTDGMGVDKHMSGRPVITFSISSNNLVNLELVQGKENEQENEIIENFREKEQIENFKGKQIENSNGNGQIESFVEDEMLENFKENGHITNPIHVENSEVNEEIENQTENFQQIEISVQNVHVESFNEHEQSENSLQSESLEISKKNDYSSKQLLRHTSSKKLPSELLKFWHQRYLLFSLYDEGIMMDEEGWYSVTPEYLAEYLAKRCACDTIIDAMCGVGGNAIQFAKTCKKVIAIDIDETKLYCARNNASIYGVEDKIDFILGDFYDLIPQLKADVVFLSPPWGGVSYLKSKVYDIKTMMPVDGERLFQKSRKITKNIAYYVPRTINFDQMKKLCDPEICEFQQVIVWEKIKSYIVYYGDLVGNHYSEVIKTPKYWAIDTSKDYIEETENQS